MTISDELKEKILTDFKLSEPEMLKAIKKTPHNYNFVQMPFLSDGVIDRAEYSVSQNKFVRLYVKVATEGIMPLLFGGNEISSTAYCNKYEIATIDL